MGWSVAYNTTLAAEMRDLARTETWTAPDGTVHTRETLKHCLRGCTYYAVVRSTVAPQDGPVEVTTWIHVAHVQRAGDNSVAVKEMTEDAGPNEVNCPLSYLDMADPPRSEYARAWREKVRAYHAENDRKRAMLGAAREGDVVVLRKGCAPNRLVFEKPTRHGCLARFMGTRYRVSLKHVESVEYGERPPEPPRCTKERKQDRPYEIWRAGDWEWRVLKKWQKDDSKKYARWFCAVKSPFTFGDYELGDVYVADVKGQAALVATDYD